MFGFLKFALTATEGVLSVTSAALGTKLVVDSVKQDNSAAYHTSKVEEIKTKKAKKEADKAEAKRKADEKAAQDLAITIIKNSRHAGGIKNILDAVSL